jgi:hypothetical protein
LTVWPAAGGRVAVAKRLGLALFHPPAAVVVAAVVVAAVVVAAVVCQRLGPQAQ